MDFGPTESTAAVAVVIAAIARDDHTARVVFVFLKTNNYCCCHTTRRLIASGTMRRGCNIIKRNGKEKNRKVSVFFSPFSPSPLLNTKASIAFFVLMTLHT